jgi:hypothetical protein
VSTFLKVALYNLIRFLSISKQNGADEIRDVLGKLGMEAVGLNFGELAV